MKAFQIKVQFKFGEKNVNNEINYFLLPTLCHSIIELYCLFYYLFVPKEYYAILKKTNIGKNNLNFDPQFKYLFSIT